MPNKFIIMDEIDNCATSLEEIDKGRLLKFNDKSINIKQKIPLGHKFALSNITKGEKIIKYGQIIGIATEEIAIGEWIHTHNITSHYLEEVAQ
ncbi:MAG: UxaA family hydrolase [Promethearchaeati archaeon]